MDNTVLANLLAAARQNPYGENQFYQVSLGDQTSLNDLFKLIVASLFLHCHFQLAKLSYRDFRAVNVRHSRADISKAQALLGYAPTIIFEVGVAATMFWYLSKVLME
jgi:UDP-N-acetylglucosamine 4-epimerase